MALGSQTQACLTHWATPKSYPFFSYLWRSSNEGWKYSGKMFEHFYLKFFIPGTWNSSQCCLPESTTTSWFQTQSGQSDLPSWDSRKLMTNGWVELANGNATMCSWAQHFSGRTPKEDAGRDRCGSFRQSTLAWKSFCEAIISTWNSSLQRHRLSPLESRHTHTLPHTWFKL